MVDKKSVKILKFIKKNPNIPLDELKKKYGEFANDSLAFLQKNNYIINETKGYAPVHNGSIPVKSNKFRISPKGLAYLQEKRKEAIKYWLPIITADALSATAIGVSIYSIWLQYQ